MRHAIFTIDQDEPFFFPLWHKHYRLHYDPTHMYVLYHPLASEPDYGPEWLRVPVFRDTNLIRVLHDVSFDHTWLRVQVERFAAFLLGSYDTVTFTEADEIIVPNPATVKEHSLTHWLDGWCERGEPAVRCTGYEVVHRFETEPGLAAEEVLTRGWYALAHRGWWYPSEIYSKTLTWREPPRWDNGFHDAFRQGAGLLDLPKEPDLLLLHLHKVDYRIAVARWKRTAARNWGPVDPRLPRAGIQNRFKTEAELQEWWYRSIDEPTRAAPLAPLPAQLKDAI